MNKRLKYLVIISAVLVMVTVLSLTSQVIAQMGGGHSMGKMSGMGGSGHSMSGGMEHNAPGAVQQICHPAGDMPPHYCEPTYHTMSSVRGIRIGTVDAANDNEVIVSLKQIGKSAPPVSKKLVLVGGSGNLAGATIIDSGWSKSTTVHLKLDGFGTIYDYGAMHIHLFPYTGE